MANHTAPVPSWLTTDYMENILKNTGHFTNLKVHKVEISAGSNVGDNYAGQILRFCLKISNNGKIEELSIIGKYEPKTELMESMGEFFDVFKVETYFLTKALPQIHKKLNNYFAPFCYTVDVENKLILLEDLKAKNFSMHDKSENMFLNLEECLLTVEALAKLHGASYSMVKSDESLKKIFNKGFWSSVKNESMDNIFSNAQKALSKFIPNYGLSESQSKRLKNFSDNLCVDYCKVCDFNESKLNVLLHGDCWKNNLMFSYSNGLATEVKLLDFQLVNYNCFANDLQYLIFSSTSSDVIVNNIDRILETYYKKLKNVAPEIPNLTFDCIKKEFAERYNFGLILAVTFRASILSGKPLDIAALFRGEFLELGFNAPSYISDLKKFLNFFEENCSLF